MSKRLLTAMILALGVVLLLTNGIAGAASRYSNLTGTWSGPSPGVYWQGGNNPYATFMGAFTLVVTFQDENGSFYGTFSDDPLVGSITTGKVISAIVYNGPAYMIINAKLTGTKIQGTYNYFNTAGHYIQAGKFELTKQEP
jgi:hypothetical protein